MVDSIIPWLENSYSSTIYTYTPVRRGAKHRERTTERERELLITQNYYGRLLFWIINKNILYRKYTKRIIYVRIRIMFIII